MRNYRYFFRNENWSFLFNLPLSPLDTNICRIDIFSLQHKSMYVHCMCSNSQLHVHVYYRIRSRKVHVQCQCFADYILSGFAPATMSLHVRINILLASSHKLRFSGSFLLERGPQQTSKQRQLELCSLFLSCTWRRRSHDCESAHATAPARSTSNMFMSGSAVGELA